MCYNLLIYLKKSPALKENSINYITNLQKLACKEYSKLQTIAFLRVFCRKFHRSKTNTGVSNALIYNILKY